MRRLKRLQRDQEPKSPFVFTSERGPPSPPQASRAWSSVRRVNGSHGDDTADPPGEGKTAAKHAYFWQSLLHLRELIDRLDGRPIQSIDRNDLLVTELSDGELLLIASGRGQTEDEMKLIPPPSKD